MDDLISRQAALDLLRKRLIETANNNVGYTEDAGFLYEELANNRIKNWLYEVPSEDVQPVPHGRWVLFDGYYCSNCNYKLQTTGIPKYCPNCGAEMERP